jgi:hypothetical protein
MVMGDASSCCCSVFSGFPASRFSYSLLRPRFDSAEVDLRRYVEGVSCMPERTYAVESSLVHAEEADNQPEDCDEACG